MIADIFIISKGRTDILRRSLKSFVECTNPKDFRLTFVDDTGGCLDSDKRDDIYRQYLWEDNRHIIIHRENEGLGPSINEALAHIDALRKWDELAPPFTVYVQDDVRYSKDWLVKLSSKFIQLERPLNLGFASGIECVEHPIKKDLGNGLITKDWIRATSMFARHSYWMSMWPISRIDPETGRLRGKPDNGMGSSVDWWFIRNHANSVCKTGRTNLVMPGLLQHMGYYKSTWLDRELPESEADKQAVKDHEPCMDCGIEVESKDLIWKGNHHGGQKHVCSDRTACNRRSPG